MATPLTDSIEALTTYINEVTGETDDNLSDAIATLVAGYGTDEMTLIQSLAVNDVNSASFTITDTLFNDYKSIIVIPNIKMSSSDWLYLTMGATNVYVGKTDYATYPRFIMIKLDNTYEYLVRTGLGLPKNARMLELESESTCNYHTYTNSVTMNGSINIYGTSLDIYKE